MEVGALPPGMACPFGSGMAGGVLAKYSFRSATVGHRLIYRGGPAIQSRDPVYSRVVGLFSRTPRGQSTHPRQAGRHPQATRSTLGPVFRPAGGALGV